MVKCYTHILLVHSHEVRQLCVAVLEIERIAFLDGYYFASAIRTCRLCTVCSITQGKPCSSPEKVRPCDQSFGIDVYKTARNLGLPIQVLQSKNDPQNRWFRAHRLSKILRLNCAGKEEASINRYSARDCIRTR